MFTETVLVETDTKEITFTMNDFSRLVFVWDEATLEVYDQDDPNGMPVLNSCVTRGQAAQQLFDMTEEN